MSGSGWISDTLRGLSAHKLKKTQRKKKTKKNIWIGEMAAVVGAAVVVGSDEQPWWLAAGQEHMYNLSFVG